MDPSSCREFSNKILSVNRTFLFIKYIFLFKKTNTIKECAFKQDINRKKNIRSF